MSLQLISFVKDSKSLLGLIPELISFCIKYMHVLSTSLSYVQGTAHIWRLFTPDEEGILKKNEKRKMIEAVLNKICYGTFIYMNSNFSTAY